MRRCSRSTVTLAAFAVLTSCSGEAPTEVLVPLAFDGVPVLGSVSQSSLTVSVASNRDATLHAVVQPAEAPMPGALAIRSGIGGDGEPALDAATVELRASSRVPIQLAGLVPYGDHVVALLLDDGSDEVVTSLTVRNPLATAVDEAGELAHLRSMLVSVGGELVAESYFNGSARDSLQDVRSVTKGITALLVGQAIEQGYLDLDTMIGETFPQTYLQGLEPAKRDITVEHLLTMSSGLGWVENEFAVWTQLLDEIEAILSRDLTSAPGSVFEYSTPDLQMLSVIFQESTGRTLHEFANEHLFAQLGIEASRWVLFETGYALAGGFSFITSRDMVEIGEMVLNGGVHDGVRVVDEAYLAAATSPKFSFASYLNTGPDFASRWFGYLWWEAVIDGVEGFMTSGYGGQNIIVFPTRDLVVVTTSVAQVPPAQANDQQVATWSAVARAFRAMGSE